MVSPREADWTDYTSGGISLAQSYFRQSRRVGYCHPDLRPDGVWLG